MTEEAKKPASSSFRNTLRRLAAEQDPAERARVADLFASQIEIALDTQGGNMQIALWNVEESVHLKFDHIHEQIGNSNTLQSAVLEAIGGLRTDVQQSAIEVAARLGKTETEVAEIREGQNTLATRVSGLGEEVSTVSGKVDTLSTEVNDLKRRVGTVESTLARVETVIARTQQMLEHVVSRSADQPMPDEMLNDDTAAEQ